MARSKLFAVSADTMYEGREVVAVFDTELAAATFAARCSEHDLKHPECPPIEDSPENDALWDKWGKKSKAWAKAHPAKQISTRDSYSVFAIPYFKQDTQA